MERLWHEDNSNLINTQPEIQVPPFFNDYTVKRKINPIIRHNFPSHKETLNQNTTLSPSHTTYLSRTPSSTSSSIPKKSRLLQHHGQVIRPGSHRVASMAGSLHLPQNNIRSNKSDSETEDEGGGNVFNSGYWDVVGSEFFPFLISGRRRNFSEFCSTLPGMTLSNQIKIKT